MEVTRSGAPKIPEVYWRLIEDQRMALFEARAIVVSMILATAPDDAAEGELDVNLVCQAVSRMLDSCTSELDPMRLQQLAAMQQDEREVVTSNKRC